MSDAEAPRAMRAFFRLFDELGMLRHLGHVPEASLLGAPAPRSGAYIPEAR